MDDKLDESWEAKHGYHVSKNYLAGASDFQKRAISELNKHLDSMPDNGATWVYAQIHKAIAIIKELKAE